MTKNYPCTYAMLIATVSVPPAINYEKELIKKLEEREFERKSNY